MMIRKSFSIGDLYVALHLVELEFGTYFPRFDEYYSSYFPGYEDL